MSIRILLLGAAASASFLACRFDDAGLGTPSHGAVDARAVDAPQPPDAAPDARIDARPPDAGLPCPSGYTIDPATGTGYRYGTLNLQWSSAEGDCEFDGPGIHLAVITTETELQHVANLVGTSHVWVGVSDLIKENHFRWVTGGVATFVPWQNGEPNNQGNEDCVELINGEYNDTECLTTIQRYVCECDGVAVDYNAF